MKSKEEKLLELVQPKDYVSKIKLYCHNSKLEVVKFGSLENREYICRRIKIEDR